MRVSKGANFRDVKKVGGVFMRLMICRTTTNKLLVNIES